MAERINVREAHDHVQAGAMLVCAYDSDDEWQQNCLEGAISLTDLRAQQKSIPTDRELIFYCA